MNRLMVTEKNDRQFISNKDTGIYMSILINPNCLIEESLKNNNFNQRCCSFSNKIRL